MNIPSKFCASFCNVRLMRLAAMSAAFLLLGSEQSARAVLSGSGTAEDPFLVASAGDWAEFAADVNAARNAGAFFALASDVTDATAMVGTEEHPFSGTFDGGGHTLTVDIADNDNAFVAPFSFIDGATISNLHVVGTVSSSQYHATGLVGDCGETALNTIVDCTVSVDVTGSPYTGGFVGHGEESELTLERCVFDGSLSGFAYCAGGLVGWCGSMTLHIDDCLVKGTFAPAYGGRFHPIACQHAPCTVAASVERAYYLNTLEPTASDDNLIPEAEGIPVSETHVPGEWWYPVTAADGVVYYLEEAPSDAFQMWDGTISSEFDWELFGAGLDSGVESYATMNVTLSADIAVSTMVGTEDHPFSGTFNGGGHTLTVDIVDNDNVFVAPFSFIDGATISNLHVAGTVSGTQDHAAGLVGVCCDTTALNAILDCTVSVEVSGAPNSGGIVGHGGAGDSLRLERCVFDGSLSDFTDHAGGLVGWCGPITLHIDDCFVKGTFDPGYGGSFHPIVCTYAPRSASATVERAYYLNTLEPTASDDDLIPGAEGTPVSEIHVPGEWWYPVTAADGVVYYLEDAPSDAFQMWDGSISSEFDWELFGVGLDSGAESYATMNVTLAADISVSTMVGTEEHPFSGTFDGGGHTLTVDIVDNDNEYVAPFSWIDGATISNLHVAGTVSGTQYPIAGLVGGCGETAPNAILDCTVSVDVSGAPHMGGFVGQGEESELTLERCVFDGSLSGFTAYAGGLVGWCNSMTLHIDDCLVKGTFEPASWGEFHPIACKYPPCTVAASIERAYYLNTLEPTATGNLIPGAEGIPVSETHVPGEWWYPVTAADSVVYYLEDAPSDAFQMWDGIISSEFDWELFGAGLDSGVESYETMNVTLAADISVSTTVGTEEHPFSGTFDGGGHILTADIVDNDNAFVAPFSIIDGATISNLHVVGTVSSTQYHAAGLVGGCCDTTALNAILDCTVSVEISGAPYSGGIVGHGGAGDSLRLERCVFDGSLNGFAYCAGGLVGWCGSMTLHIDDCLVKGTFAPGHVITMYGRVGGQYHPIACKLAGETVAATATRAYYLNTLEPSATGGKLISGAEGIPVSAIHVAGEWAYPVRAADGLTYYVPDAGYAFGQWLSDNGYPPCAATDPAANGLTCYENFLLDIDPASTNTLFPDLTGGNGEFILRNASSNRWYLLDYTTNLLEGFTTLDLGRGQPGDWRIAYPSAQDWFGRIRARLAAPDWHIVRVSSDTPSVDAKTSEEDVRAAIREVLKLQKNDGSTQELPADFAITGEIDLDKPASYPITVGCADPDGITQLCDVEFQVNKLVNPLNVTAKRDYFAVELNDATIQLSREELYNISTEVPVPVFSYKIHAPLPSTITVGKYGAITIISSAPNGTYILRINVQTPETALYKAATASVTIKIVVQG